MRTIQSSILGVAMGFWLVGCNHPPVEEEPVVRPIKIHTIGSLQPAAMREYPGTIRAYQTAEMGFEVSGRVTEFLVREGDDVEQGQVLARLDARDYDATLKVAEANLAKNQADLARNVGIRRKSPGAVTQAEIDINERAVKVTEAQL